MNPFDTQKLLDDVGWKLIECLQTEGRVSFAELGRRVGLSTPAVTERVRRLEEAGIITGYHAAVDTTRLGYPIAALVRLAVAGEQSTRVARMLMAIPEVVQCHHVTGADCYVCTVLASSIPHLEALIDQLARFGSTTTSLVMSTPIQRRTVSVPEPHIPDRYQ